MSTRSVSVKELRAECDLLEKTVVRARFATEEELKTYRPGKENNPSTGPRGWLRYYAVLHRKHAMGEDTVSHPKHGFDDATVLDALRNEPVPVTLLGAGPDDPPIFVYAKSLDAHLHVHTLDLQLAWMLSQKTLLEADASAESINLLVNVADVIAYTYQLLCWIVTTEGPDMPYATEDVAPVIPDHIKKLEPWDVVRICQAHQKHLVRLSALSALINDKPSNKTSSQRPSWSMFIGAMAVELGESTVTLMKHRSLAELLASSRLNHAAKSSQEQVA